MYPGYVSRDSGEAHISTAARAPLLYRPRSLYFKCKDAYTVDIFILS